MIDAFLVLGALYTILLGVYTRVLVYQIGREFKND